MSFLVQLTPRPNEPLLGSYFIRLCEANGLPSFSWLAELLERHTTTKIRTSLELIQRPKFLATLENLIPTPTGALQERGWRPLPTAESEFYWIDGEGFYDEVLMTRRAQVCPSCLAEGQPAPDSWLLAFLPVCAKHGVALIDTCPACHHAISNDRFSLGRCHHCGQHFHKSALHPATPAAIDMAASIVKHRGLLLGSRRNHVELDLNECGYLFSLAAAALIPYTKLLYVPTRNDALSAAERLAGFERLAAGWRGEYLDPHPTREALCAKWPYLERISPTLKSRRLAAYLDGRKLNERIVSALLGGDPDKPVFMAAHSLGKRMPYARTRSQAARYLKVTPAEFDDYQRATGWINKTDADWCYDADELMQARRLLSETRSTSALHELLGSEGLSQVLLDAGLLKPWSSCAPEGRRYAPWDIQHLYDELWSLLRREAPSSPLISLEVLQQEHALDHHASSALMVLILRRDIGVFDWRPPYRIGDIRVERDVVLRALRDLAMDVPIGPAEKSAVDHEGQ